MPPPTFSTISSHLRVVMGKRWKKDDINNKLWQKTGIKRLNDKMNDRKIKEKEKKGKNTNAFASHPPEESKRRESMILLND